MQRVVLAGEYLVVDHAWRHAPPAGERHDAVFREGLDRKDRILVGDRGAAEIGQHALQCVAAPLAEGGAVFLDQVLGDQLLELGPQARVEPPDKDRLLVGDLDRLLGHHFSSFAGLPAPAFALPLPAPCQILRGNAEQAAAQEQHRAKHDAGNQDQPDRAEADEHLVEQHDDQGAQHRAFGGADAADNDHRQQQQQLVDREQRRRGAVKQGRVEGADAPQCRRRDQEYLDARGAIVDAKSFGKGLVLLGRSAQQAAKALAVDHAVQNQRAEQQQ